MDFSINDYMLEILQTMESQTKALCLDTLTPAYFRELLSHLNITVHEDMTADKMKDVLLLSSIYMEKFNSYELGDIVVFFNDFQVVNIVTKDKKVALYELDCEYPCVVCHFNVDDDGDRGQGLECSVCESWFHNDCTDAPLTNEFYSSLANSPDFIKICCPSCLKNGQVKLLHKQLAKIQSDFTDDLIDVKKLITDSQLSFVGNSLEKESTANLASIVDDLRKEIKHVIEKEVGGLKIDLEVKLGSIVDFQRNSVAAINADLSTLSNDVTSMKTKFENFENYCGNTNVISCIQEIKESADMATRSMESLNVKEAASEYKEVVQQLKDNAEELTLTVNSNMSSLYQSTENALEKINSIDVNNLHTSITTLDSRCREQVTQTTALAEAVKDISKEVKDGILTDSVVTKLAAKICDEIGNNPATVQKKNLDQKAEAYSSVAEKSTPTQVAKSRYPQLSATSSIGSTPSTSLRTPQRQMDEHKTISIGNIKDKELVISSAKIKSQFNKCFPRMEIVHCKKSMNGFVLIELDTYENAKQVVEKWEGSKFFNTSMDKHNPTEVNLLEDVRAKAVIEDVDKDFTDVEITANLQEQFPLAKARRFINKHGPTHCVLLTFKSKEDLEKACNSRVLISDIPFRLRPYETRKIVVQCYNCYGFRHIATHCRKRKTCPYCSQNHAEADCLIKKDNLEDQYKCTNCKGNHSAIDKNCEKYKMMTQNLSQSSNDQ